MKYKFLPVILCIGTDLLSGDCLGPLVGEILIQRNVPAFVYGRLNNPVTALNLDQYNKFITVNHLGTVIAVDSAVGQEVGKICIEPNALFPGAASGKDLPAVGDVGITAVTSCFTPSDRRFALVRLGFLYDLANKVADKVEEIILKVTPRPFRKE